MLVAKSEKDALSGTLFFNFVHYAIRPWPWILVALCSFIIYPSLNDIHLAFPNVDLKLIGHDMAYPAMLRFLPHGFLGIMVAGLLAAYVSTLVTHLNWGSSYLVHDFYRRFLHPGASEKHYVSVARLTTVVLMILASLLTFILESAKASFRFDAVDWSWNWFNLSFVLVLVANKCLVRNTPWPVLSGWLLYSLFAANSVILSPSISLS